MTKQKLCGLALIAISAAALLLACFGTTPEERDATAVVLLLPLGVYALTTKKHILYNCETAQDKDEIRNDREDRKLREGGL